MMTRPRSAASVLLELLPDDLVDVLDIGCGSGALHTPLTRAGKRWHGIDPLPPGTDGIPRDQGRAEALPYADRSFDAAIFVNALHHVPPAHMRTALAEAARVTRSGGRVVVIEPKADGDMSQVIAAVDDETAIRAAARDAVFDSGSLTRLDGFLYDRVERFRGFDDFLAALVAVDPDRAETARHNGAELRARFDRFARREPDGLSLDQPMEVHVLAPAAGPVP